MSSTINDPAKTPLSSALASPSPSLSLSPVSVDNCPPATTSDSLENLLSCRSQVCDRCRKLKKKCYGTGAKCNNCLISNQECATTKTLKRKRKPKPTKLNPIEIENIKLKLKLQELQQCLNKSVNGAAKERSDKLVSCESAAVAAVAPPTEHYSICSEMSSRNGSSSSSIVAVGENSSMLPPQQGVKREESNQIPLQPPAKQEEHKHGSRLTSLSSSASSPRVNSTAHSAAHSPISSDEASLIIHDIRHPLAPALRHSVSQHQKRGQQQQPHQHRETPPLLSAPKKNPARPIRNHLASDAEFVKSIAAPASRASALSPDLLSNTQRLPNQDNYNGPAIIEEYSIVDNFLQQDFLKILKEQKHLIRIYVDRFFAEINELFPIILEKDYFLRKVDELVHSIDVTNFNTNVINDEHNLCIVYKTILICMFYIQDANLKNRYLKTTKHLLSRFEFLDPINTLKCHLLTHLYAQMNNDKPLLVRTNGLVCSLALNLKLHRETEDRLKRELWFVCYCFDFFVNDPVNSGSLGDGEQLRMINDHTIFENAALQKPLLRIVDIKRRVYSNKVSVGSAIAQLLGLQDLSALVLLAKEDDSVRDPQLSCSFASAFTALYYLDALMVLQRSLITNWKSKSLTKNAAALKQLEDLHAYAERFVRVWAVNIKAYKHIPLINLCKLFQCGSFISWYIKRGLNNDPSCLETAGVGISATDLKRTQSVPGDMSAHCKQFAHKYLIMAMDVLNQQLYVNDAVKQYQAVLKNLLFDTSDGQACAHMDAHLGGCSAAGPFKKKARVASSALAVPANGFCAKAAAESPHVSADINQMARELTSTSSLFEGNRGSRPSAGADVQVGADTETDAKSSERTARQYSLFAPVPISPAPALPMGTTRSQVGKLPPIKPLGPSGGKGVSNPPSQGLFSLAELHSNPLLNGRDTACGGIGEQSMEEQLNDFVSGFTFDGGKQGCRDEAVGGTTRNGARNGAGDNTGDTAGDNTCDNAGDNTCDNAGGSSTAALSRPSQQAETEHGSDDLFGNLQELVDLKRVNELYNIKF